MSWIRKVEQGHPCDLPANANVQPGSVWQCDDCGAYWKVVPGGAYDPPWRRISDRRGHRLARREGLKRGFA
jgi:ribosomal protein L37AE/L43A